MNNESGKGVGARLRRKEDARYLTGRGQFVGDIRRAGMLEVAFLRSPVAHARIHAIIKPAGLEDRAWVMDDLVGVKPVRAVSLSGFSRPMWPLALDKCATSRSDAMSSVRRGPTRKT